MKSQFLEIVTPDVEGTIAMFAASHEAVFSNPIPAFGNGRVAKMPDGGQISVRAPMHESEEPVTRSYYLTNDIEGATQRAIASGATLAHPVMDIPGEGKFSIVFHGENQFGFWQL